MTELTLRHLPFYEALATSPGEDSPEWRAASAGLLALRLVDRILVSVDRVTASELASARVALGRMAQGDPLALVIRRTLQALESEHLGRIATALRDVGRVLLSKAAWGLARDVYETGVEAAEAAPADDLMLECLFGQGHAIRMLREFDAAADHYRRLHRTAMRLGDTRYQLEARLGLAKLTIDRGDFAAAASRLDRLISHARAVGCVVVESKALHDRARVAGETGDNALALRLAYDALQRCEEPRERDRILTDLSQALMLMGERAAARDASLVVATTAQERETRWLATIHLMTLASLDRRLREFEFYAEELANEPLPPARAAGYLGCAGAGYQAFGLWEEARERYIRMRSVAEEHRLAKEVIEADDALRRIQSRDAGAPTATMGDEPNPTPVDDHVRWVASEITRLRERTVVSA